VEAAALKKKQEEERKKQLQINEENKKQEETTIKASEQTEQTELDISGAVSDFQKNKKKTRRISINAHCKYYWITAHK